MNLLEAVIAGTVIGLLIGVGTISTIHRRVWGHWRFWEPRRRP